MVAEKGHREYSIHLFLLPFHNRRLLAKRRLILTTASVLGLLIIQ